MESLGAQLPLDPGLHHVVGFLTAKGLIFAQMSILPLQFAKLQSRENELSSAKALGATDSGKIIASASLRLRKIHHCLCVRAAAEVSSPFKR